MRYPPTSIASELSLPCMYASLRNILAAVLLLTSVHGRREDKLLYVPVHVGGHGPYWFAVDSGAHNSVIDPFIVEELGLTVTGTMTTKGTGEGDVPVRTVAPLDMRIGDVTLKIAEPWAIDLSGVPLPKWVERPRRRRVLRGVRRRARSRARHDALLRPGNVSQAARCRGGAARRREPPLFHARHDRCEWQGTRRAAGTHRHRLGRLGRRRDREEGPARA